MFFYLKSNLGRPDPTQKTPGNVCSGKRQEPLLPASRGTHWCLGTPGPCLSITRSQNHRMVGVGRDLCGSPSPTPCRSRVTQSRLHSTAARRVWNISREGDSTTSLGSLGQCSMPSVHTSYRSSQEDAASDPLSMPREGASPFTDEFSAFTSKIMEPFLTGRHHVRLLALARPRHISCPPRAQSALPVGFPQEGVPEGSPVQNNHQLETSTEPHRFPPKPCGTPQAETGTRPPPHAGPRTRSLLNAKHRVGLQGAPTDPTFLPDPALFLPPKHEGGMLQQTQTHPSKHPKPPRWQVEKRHPPKKSPDLGNSP